MSEDTQETPPQMNEMEMLKSRARIMGVEFSNNIGLETLKERINAKLNGEEIQQANTPEPTTASPLAVQAAKIDATMLPASNVLAQSEAAPTSVNKDPLPIPAATAATVDTSISDANIQKVQANADLAPPEPKPEPIPEAPVVRLSLRQHLYNENMKLVRLRITNLDPKKKDLPGEVLTVANEYIGTVRKYIPFGEMTEGGYHVPYCLYTELKSRKFLNIRTRKDKRTGAITTDTSWVPEFSLEVLEPLTPEEMNNLATAQIAAGSFDES